MSTAAQSVVSAERPFPGLRPFAYEDHDYFFGRDDQIFALYRLIERNRFIAVIGSSGCGKSSLVRAGLLPAISNGYLAVDSNPDDEVWRIVIIRPGDDPYGALAESLSRTPSAMPWLRTRMPSEPRTRCGSYERVSSVWRMPCGISAL